MAMHLAKLAGTAIVLSLVVHPGYAVELIPIELTAISQAVDVSLLGTPGVQSSSGTSDVVVQWTDFDGWGNASVSEIDGLLIFRHEGAVTTTASIRRGPRTTGSHQIEFDVPDLGDATTTVFARLREEASSHTGLDASEIIIDFASGYGSTILGESVHHDFQALRSGDTNETQRISGGTFIPGDRVRLTLDSQAEHFVQGPGSGSYDESHSFSLFAVQPIPEPTNATQLGAGIIGLLLIGLRRVVASTT